MVDPDDEGCMVRLYSYNGGGKFLHFGIHATTSHITRYKNPEDQNMNFYTHEEHRNLRTKSYLEVIKHSYSWYCLHAIRQAIRTARTEAHISCTATCLNLVLFYVVGSPEL